MERPRILIMTCFPRFKELYIIMVVKYECFSLKHVIMNRINLADVSLLFLNVDRESSFSSKRSIDRVILDFFFFLNNVIEQILVVGKFKHVLFVWNKLLVKFVCPLFAWKWITKAKVKWCSGSQNRYWTNEISWKEFSRYCHKKLSNFFILTQVLSL